MQPEDFQQQFDVSHETFAKLQAYHALLLKWQAAINLISPKTIQESWQRHFADSAQILPYISESIKTLVDLGSGAGFPGLVIGIMRPDIEVHLIESDERKAQFLRTVSRETGAENVTVENARIEEIEGLKPDLITARALSDLPTLLRYAEIWATDNPALEMLFLKGQSYAEEIADAQKHFGFDVKDYPSQTADEGRILFINGLKAR
ncbi:MAG: 16S rRNA (guanine(527)-N(7))-methyltransferase RsmG [Alphaproteobacteria bacterium]|nr:16S rRNA (guanine(527)-N(7))-methyltransferase RsmG [Alphaproteobacteria bacterium]